MNVVSFLRRIEQIVVAQKRKKKGKERHSRENESGIKDGSHNGKMDIIDTDKNMI